MRTELEWGPKQIEDYFLACTSSPKAADLYTVPYKHMPISLKLSPEFYDVLSMMLAETNDDLLEKYTYCGVKSDRVGVFINHEFVTGEYNGIPSDLIEDLCKAVDDSGKVTCGDFHTHYEELITSFSGSDIYDFISASWGNRLILLSGAANSNELLVALKSREGLHQDTHWLTDELFSYHWEKRYKVSNLDDSINIESLWKMNLGLGRRFKFRLYKGKLGERLIWQRPIINLK